MWFLVLRTLKNSPFQSTFQELRRSLEEADMLPSIRDWMNREQPADYEALVSVLYTLLQCSRWIRVRCAHSRASRLSRKGIFVFCFRMLTASRSHCSCANIRYRMISSTMHYRIWST
jgi:hypothetical protein